MRYLKKCFFTTVLLVFIFAFQGYSQTKIMTYNIRYDNRYDGDNWWGNRKAELVAMLDYYHPGILGIQEGLFNQVTYIDSALTNYTYIGVGREDGKEKGEYAAVFYDTTMFECVENKTFWLSETPEVVSVGLYF